MRRGAGPAFVAAIALASGMAGRAQTPAAALPHIRIFAAGGLLGQYDGMPEYPGGSFDRDVGPGIHPYGGVEGLLKWWTGVRQPDDLLLLTANNFPQNTTDAASIRQFLDRIHRLDPSAMALGTEDFLRGLASAGSAGAFVASIRTSNLPFVVSNAAVRLHGAGLNRVADHGFFLEFDPDESVAWVSDVVMAYPCDRTGLRAALTPSGAAAEDVRVAPQTTVRAGRCRARLSFPALLRPATEYRLEIRISGDLMAAFRFRTDELLTPKAWLAPAAREQPLVVTLVDPRVRSMLEQDRWQWRDSRRSTCTAESCEILLLPPIEAFDQVIALAEGVPTGRPVALMSDLDDEDTFAVLQHSTRVRFLVLPPDSAALGRAAARTAITATGQRGGGRGASPRASGQTIEGPYSGDLGYGAVLNMNQPAATEVWSRPEWFGETIHEMAADVDTATWELTHVVHEVHSVKGAALCATSQGKGVDYFLADWAVVNGSVQYTKMPDAPAIASAPDRYVEVAPDVAYDPPRRIAQGALWTDKDSFAAAALDAMRTGLNTDVALLPDDAIDENQLVYLQEDSHAPTQALSKLFLWRVLFRAGPVVKVRVSGTALVDTVNKVLSAGRADGVTYCLSGFDATGCASSRLATRAVIVNGRRLNKIRFYTIALPESVALENNLPRYGHASRDLADLMDRRFARRTEGAVATCAPEYRAAAAGTGPNEPLASRLEDMNSHGSTPYLTITPAEFAFSQAVVGEPPGGTGLFNKLGLQASGTKPNERMSVNLGMDVGIYDVPRFELRSLGTVAYGRAKVNGQSSTDPNTSLAALRFDWKLPRGRLFGGAFWESQFGDQVTQVTAASKGASGPTLSLVTRRRDYRYAGFGFELERPDVAKWLSVDPFRVSVATGVSQHEHVDVEIEGQSQTIELFQQLGATNLLNRYYQAHPGLSASSSYAFVDHALHRNRVQIDATPRITMPVGGKTLTVSVASSYRRFVGPNALPLAERQSATVKLTVAVPLFGISTLNVNQSEYVAQVNGIGGWFTVWQPSVSVSIPLIANRHAGIVY